MVYRQPDTVKCQGYVKYPDQMGVIKKRELNYSAKDRNQDPMSETYKGRGN